MTGSAIFSPDRRYRWVLRRKKIRASLFPSSPRPFLWCGFNPSTADEHENDPTIRREIDFSARLGGTELIKVNLFGLVSTDPRGLLDVDDPVGHDNSDYIEGLVQETVTAGGLCIAAWGAPKPASMRDRLRAREKWAASLVNWLCLGTTKDGHPRHPLYLRRDTKMQFWEPPTGGDA